MHALHQRFNQMSWVSSNNGGWLGESEAISGIFVDFRVLESRDLICITTDLQPVI